MDGDGEEVEEASGAMMVRWRTTEQESPHPVTLACFEQADSANIFQELQEPGMYMGTSGICPSQTGEQRQPQ